MAEHGGGGIMMDLQARTRIIERISRGTAFTVPEVCPSEGWNRAAHEGLKKAEAARLVAFVNGKHHPGPVALTVRSGDTVADTTARAEVVVCLIENAFANPPKEPPKPLDLEGLRIVAETFEEEAGNLPADPPGWSGIHDLAVRFRCHLRLYAAAPELLEVAKGAAGMPWKSNEESIRVGKVLRFVEGHDD